MNNIIRPLNEAGDIGYDEFNLLVVETKQGNYGTVRRWVPDLRKRTCSICGSGWELTAEAWDDYMWWSQYEETIHESCMVRYCGLRDREIFSKHFISARLRFERIISIPNRYHQQGRWSSRPWYLIPLLDHPVDFIIGLRKRVVHIEATPRGETTFSWWEIAKDAFAEESVTKGFYPRGITVHAWTRKKERDYIQWIAKAGQLSYGL